MTWVHDGGRGGYLCDGCRTMICSGLRADAPLDDAREAHRLSAVVSVPGGGLFCSTKCAMARATAAVMFGGPAVNQLRPAFSALRTACGNILDDRTALLALGPKQVGSVFWFWALREHNPRDFLACAERLRDAPDARDVIDAAYRLGGAEAARPLLDEFFGRPT